MNQLDPSIEQTVRRILRETQSIPSGADHLTAETDLYAAGLTSLASVNLMLAIEEEFDFFFPDDALNRRTFSTIGAMSMVIGRLTRSAAA